MWLSKINGYRGERIMKKYSKRYKELIKFINTEKKIELKELIDLVTKNSTTKSAR